MNSTPTTVRHTAPSPPRIDVPPTTMPASTVKVSVVATALLVGTPAVRAVSSTPATDAATPVSVNAKMRIRRSEEHTSELQSLMRISYAVFCLKKKITTHIPTKSIQAKCDNRITIIQSTK